MTPSHVALLLGAGLAAGTVNAIAGGGSLVTFPALLAVGLPAKPANFTNSVAVFPGYVPSVSGSRHDLSPEHSTLPTAAVGSVAGCLLLIATPAGAFQLIVPFLVLGAALVLAFQERLRRVVGHPHEMSGRRRAIALHTMVGLGAVYGGDFGAPLGGVVVAGVGLVFDERLGPVHARQKPIFPGGGPVPLGG